MPLPEHIREELGRKRRAEHEEAQRDTLRAFIATGLRCLIWGAAGIALLLLSFRVSEVALGRILYWSGILVGNGGILYTLLAAYRRGERRGDW